MLSHDAFIHIERDTINNWLKSMRIIYVTTELLSSSDTESVANKASS